MRCGNMWVGRWIRVQVGRDLGVMIGMSFITAVTGFGLFVCSIWWGRKNSSFFLFFFVGILFGWCFFLSL